MSKARRIVVFRTLLTFAAGLGFAAYYILSRDIGEQAAVERYRILCDGFSLPGLFLLLIGLLFAMSNLGALDSISYLMKYALRMLLPGVFGQMEHYLDYVEARREKRVRGYGFLFLVGGVLMAASLVFLILFYSVLE